MKRFLSVFLFSLFLGFSCYGLSVAAGPVRAESGPRRNVTVDPTFQDWGNNCRSRGVSVSSISAVVISTYPSNSDLNISEWRYREILNVSTGSAVRLIFGEDLFSVYSTSVGVVLSSDTTGGGLGDKYVDRSQTKISAIQSSKEGLNGQGLTILECYQK